MSRLWARCVRGLEPVVVEEIDSAGAGVVSAVAHRSVLFDSDDATGAASTLRTVDDVYAVVGEVDGVGRGRASLATVRTALDAMPLPAPAVGGFAALAVTASFLGSRNFNRFELEDAIGEVVAERSGVRYASRAGGVVPPPGAWAWRVHVEGERALVGVRLSDAPLHRRAYKVAAPPGTLHPPVAAAMVRLASAGSGALVVDPTCGAGTIVVEAGGIGGDIAPDMVRAAAANGAAVWRGAAGALPLPGSSVDAVVANLPWGRQAPLTGSIGSIWLEAARVLRTGGTAVVLAEHAISGAVPASLTLVRELPLSLMGSHPTITVLQRT